MEPVAFAEGALVRPTPGLEMATHEFRRTLEETRDLLPNPDPILRAEGRSIATYRQLVDGHLEGITGTRKAAVRARPWHIEAGRAHRPSVKKLRALFDTLDVRDCTGAILDAPFMGYSVLEIRWTVRDGWYVPELVAEKPQEWFAFTPGGELRLYGPGGMPVPPPPRQFLVARHGATYANPYGKPLLSACYWPQAFKRGGLKFWMLFVEKYGLPRAVAKVPPSTTEEERRRLLSDLAGMVRDAAAVLPNNASVELLETKSSGGGALFRELVQWADSEMSKSILGQTLTTELQDQGSLAAAKVHNEVRGDLVCDDANLVEKAWNQLIRWLWEINRPGDLDLPWFQVELPQDLQAGRLARDKGLHEIGLRFRPSYFRDVYGIEEEHIAGLEGASAPDAGGAFAEGETDATDQVVEELLACLSPEEGRAIETEMREPILALAAKADGYDAFRALLDEKFAELPTPALEQALSKFFLLSDLAGRSEAAGHA